MRLQDFDYNLPKRLIAQKPMKPRDHSRLLVIDTTKPCLEHRRFFEIYRFLKTGDVLILNDSKVFPARLLGRKSTSFLTEASDRSSITAGKIQRNTGGKVEILLLKQAPNGRWEALIKHLKEKTGLQQQIVIRRGITARTVKNLGGGVWEIEFNLTGAKLHDALEKVGRAPVPPYIKRLSSLAEYQTVYARHPGSAAAPTAGFHLTKRLLDRLKRKGIEILFVTLHVGLGTFQPVKTDIVEKHKIHSEWAEIKTETARRLNKAKKEGRRVIAVGTTATRVLESFTGRTELVKPGRKEVDLFILPGYKFRVIDGLITNFHLPKTTLLLLVAAFLGQKENNQKKGREKLFRIYREAIRRRYRFYSFGDAMFIF